ncbi:MAG: LCP family protein [Culicoidibacterales bacterium]
MSGQKIIYVDENGQPIDPSQLHLYDIVDPHAQRAQQSQTPQQVVTSKKTMAPATRKSSKKKRKRKKLKKSSTNSAVKQPKRRKKRLKWKRIVALLLVVLVVMMTLNIGGMEIVVMGLDTSQTREEEAGRTDSLMVIGLEPLKRTATLVSIPRDTYTPITCLQNESDKINHAHAYGGTNCTLDTVGQFLDIQTPYYVKTNFEGVVKIFDVLGGVPVTVQGTFCEQDSQDQPDAYCFTDGETKTLNGEEALAYARHRKTDGDEMRQVRQRQLLTAAAKEVMKPSNLFTKIPALIGAVNEMIDTNVPITKLLLMAPWFIVQPQIQSMQIEGDGDMMDGIWYMLPNQESVEEAKAAL